MTQIIYSTRRLLANPRIFAAIANELEGPDVETLKDAFFDLLEHTLEDYDDPDECFFEVTEVCFRCDSDGGKCEIIFDSGVMSVLEPIEGEFRTMISNDGEMAATSAIYQQLVKAIEDSNPELSGNIALCSPPTPGNGYLRSSDGDRFEGSFHLLTNPEKQFAFNIEIIDVQSNDLRAIIKPI
jgi:hypothetical protein